LRLPCGRNQRRHGSPLSPPAGGEFEKSFMEILLKYFSDFTPKQLEQFNGLKNLYKDWNEKINVISRKDIDNLYEKHVLHSLAIAAVFDFPAETEIIDIGTGGGFPGVPLAIFFPEVKFHLVDSIGKKIKVVDSIAEVLDLKNISTQHSRAEEIKNRKFDFVVSRAVAPLKDLWSWAGPLLKTKNIVVEGYQGFTFIKPGLICLKGGDLSKEIMESDKKPEVVDIHLLFEEDYFREKYLLYVASPNPSQGGA
jgi:16S rRNA (guanine527-N7)-methyltransferase